MKGNMVIFHKISMFLSLIGFIHFIRKFVFEIFSLNLIHTDNLLVNFEEIEIRTVVNIHVLFL